MTLTYPFHVLLIINKHANCQVVHAENTESIGLQKSQIGLTGVNNHFWQNFTYSLYTRTVSDIFKLGRTSGICVCSRAHSQQQLIEGEWRHLTNNCIYLFSFNCSRRYRVYPRCATVFMVMVMVMVNVDLYSASSQKSLCADDYCYSSCAMPTSLSMTSLTRHSQRKG